MGMGMGFTMHKFREWEWERPRGNGRDWEYWKPFPHTSSLLHLFDVNCSRTNYGTGAWTRIGAAINRVLCDFHAASVRFAFITVRHSPSTHSWTSTAVVTDPFVVVLESSLQSWHRCRETVSRINSEQKESYCMGLECKRINIPCEWKICFAFFLALLNQYVIK